MSEQNQKITGRKAATNVPKGEATQSKVAETPEARVDALCATSDSLLAKDLKEARECATQALELALDLDYGSGIRLARFLLAAADWYGGKYNEALKGAQEVLALARRAGDLNICFRALTLLNGIHGSLGNYDELVRYSLEALRVAEESGEKQRIIVALLNLGISQRDLGNYDKALDYLNRSLDLSLHEKYLKELSSIYREIGSVFVLKEQFPKALEFAQKCLEIDRPLGDSLHLSDTLNVLGIISARRGDFGAAEKSYQESLEIRRRLGDPHHICGSLQNLGVLAYRQKDYLKAIKFYNEALQIADTLGSKKLQARLHICLSDSYKDLKRYKPALEHFAIADKLNDELMRGTMEEKERRIQAQFETQNARRDAEMARLTTVELARAQQLARIGSWTWDILRESLSGSAEFVRLLFGKDAPNELSVENVLECLHPDHSEQVRNALQFAVEKKSGLDIICRLKKTPESKGATMHLIAEWVDDIEDGRPGLHGTLQDITPQLAAEEDKSERERLQGMLEMAGTFSHEMNQPMQVITTAVEIMQVKYGDQPEIMAQTNILLNAIMRMANITKRLTKTTIVKTKSYMGLTKIVDMWEGEENPFEDQDPTA